ncbi:MAG: hypothetical protein R3F30_03175 [Planctomycetota bacterium]
MRAFLPLLALALPAGLTAQTTQTFAMPKGAEKTQNKIYDSYLGYAGYDSQGNTAYTPIHAMEGYATSDMPIAAAKVQAVNLRRNNYYGNQIYASTTDLSIHMSTGASDPTSWSSTFASNHGTNKIQVFGSGGNTKTLNWPADPYVNNGQQPVPFNLKIPLDTPFVLVQTAGKSICIDYYITKRVHTYTSGSNTYHTFLILDGDGQATGNRVSNYKNSLSGCKFNDGKYNNTISYTTGGLTDAGGTWYVRYGSCPSGALGVATLSAFGVNNLPHAWPLPIDLQAVGSPGCYWNVGLEFGLPIPLKVDTNGYAAWPNVTIPAGLGGSSFFDQGLIFDKPTSTNKYGLVTTWSSEWQIAKSYTPECATIWKYKDTTPPATSGSFYKNRAAIIEVVY